MTLKTGLKAKDKGLEINVDIEDDLPLVMADGLRMEQIVLNLMDNAIRYTDHGTIALHARMGYDKKVLISIEDSGKGIPEEEIPYIFERFYRIEKSQYPFYLATLLQICLWAGGPVLAASLIYLFFRKKEEDS